MCSVVVVPVTDGGERVARDPRAVVEDLDGGTGDARLDDLADQLHRVEVVADLEPAIFLHCNRIVALDNETVTICHKQRASNRRRTTRLSGHEFMPRLLQHVLPKGLHKVR